MKIGVIARNHAATGSPRGDSGKVDPDGEESVNGHGMVSPFSSRSIPRPLSHRSCCESSPGMIDRETHLQPSSRPGIVNRPFRSIPLATSYRLPSAALWAASRRVSLAEGFFWVHMAWCPAVDPDRIFYAGRYLPVSVHSCRGLVGQTTRYFTRPLLRHAGQVQSHDGTK